MQAIPDISEEDIKKIISDVIGNDFFIKAQEQLNSQFKRSKFVQENMKYVPPVEILLNKSEVDKGEKKDVIHYVPLEDSIRALLEDKSVIEMFEKEKNKEVNSDKIVDIKDGSLYKNSSYFRENPDALSFLFYSDGVEIKNPLGAARGTYKIIQVFFTLCDIPKNQRSQIDRLQLALIFREKLLKKYSYKIIYKKIVEDLIKLENGILINIPEEKNVKVGLLVHAADNLEAHTLGGFSSCFSSKSICRFCLVQHEQLEDNIHDYDGSNAHKRWTLEEYDRIAASLPHVESFEDDDGGNASLGEFDLFNEAGDGSDVDTDDEDEDSSENSDEDEPVRDDRGVKSLCPLNVLQSFHCVTGFPPDLLHDLLEGVVAEDLLSIIRCLSFKGWFTVDAYNKALKDLGWSSSEAGDKPQSVPTARKISKLRGKAVREASKI